MPGLTMASCLATARQKATGAYYTPDAVVQSLIGWAVRSETDRLLDPSCGDGRFLLVHPNSVGVEQDEVVAAQMAERLPGRLIHEGDFFAWAAETSERFECAAGNPPFIRYQRFSGRTRHAAQNLCARHHVAFSSLSSSWAPFLVGTATLLKCGGRMAFVVPAEIGHAPYARPVLEYLASHFERVHVIAVQTKLFSQLSEDCWLLFADGYGGATRWIDFTAIEVFEFTPSPPRASLRISLQDWRRWGGRLRPFLLSDEARRLYCAIGERRDAFRLGEIARVGIGYVTGANDFFHLRPSEAARYGIPDDLLVPSVRNGRSLREGAITERVLADWIRRDEPVLLLRLRSSDRVPRSVRRYLDSEAGHIARTSYKCRTRDPWYAVPDVTIPDGFLAYMCGRVPSLVANDAGCAGTNSVHVVHLTGCLHRSVLLRCWEQDLTRLSCEIEGHPLGGGMLKLEPREAARVVLAPRWLQARSERETIVEAIGQLQRWRHYGSRQAEERTAAV